MYIKFGRYPQLEDGAVLPIEWRILKRVGSKALLISKYMLDVLPYNSEYEHAHWSNSTLRKMLNGEFLNKAFTSEERAEICYTQVTNDCICNTMDKVFLLSVEEAESLFEDDEDCRCAPTAFVKIKGIDEREEYCTKDGDYSCPWWLRTSVLDHEAFCAAYVYDDGSIDSDGQDLDCTDYAGVRPAMWVDLDKLIMVILAEDKTEDKTSVSINLDVKLTYCDGKVTVEISDKESHTSKMIENFFSPDEHPEFDADVGRELYSWLSLMAVEAREN